MELIEQSSHLPVSKFKNEDVQTRKMRWIYSIKDLVILVLKTFLSMTNLLGLAIIAKSIFATSVCVDIFHQKMP